MKKWVGNVVDYENAQYRFRVRTGVHSYLSSWLARQEQGVKHREAVK